VAVLVESLIVGLFFQVVGGLLLAGTISHQIRALDDNTKLFCQGLPGKPFLPDTREVLNLENRLQEAAARLAEHERERQESEGRFRTLFKEAPIAYHEIDAEGVIRQVNNAECELLGYDPEELHGRQAWVFVTKESREKVRRKILDRLAGTHPPTPYECDLECRDGTEITVEIHENVIRDNAKQVIGIRTALLDITARRLVDMAVRKVDQYAKELRVKNEELLVALGAAREASATKGRFLAAMSHELRTPLNGIIGLTELIYDGVVGAVSDEHKEYLGDILASSKHLLQLINDVLDIAKVESGRIEFRKDTVEIAPLLYEVRNVLRILAENKKISVAIDTGDIHSVITDSARLKQVVYNYLSNAIKFTGERGVVQVRAQREGDRALRIEVEDNGPGIEQSDVPRLFADFQQLETAKPAIGTGLGLALTKRIVEGQGGTVGLRSKPGKGSIFFAVLPDVFPQQDFRSGAGSAGCGLADSSAPRQVAVLATPELKTVPPV